MIPFNTPALLGEESQQLAFLLQKKKFSGDGSFTHECHDLLNKYLGCQKSLLTTSCTDALELAALLLNIAPGDEVVMPSFTFVSTSNAFALRGAKVVFVDINPQTMNLDEELLAAAITNKTKAIVLVHYAGWSCDMDKVMSLAKKHKLPVVEDAAQALGASYRGKKLGTFGDLACFSFHETKNVHCGEGGALIINNPDYNLRAEIIREKGTNRSQFLRGQTDKYTWVDLGSSFLPSEFNAAILALQLKNIDRINTDRLQTWNKYKTALTNVVEVLDCPSYCQGNAHLFGIKCKDIEERTRLIDFLKQSGVAAVFHYVPLHSSPAGVKYSRFVGSDKYTTKESERLVRLPLYYGLTEQDCEYVIAAVTKFYRTK